MENDIKSRVKPRRSKDFETRRNNADINSCTTTTTTTIRKIRASMYVRSRKSSWRREGGIVAIKGNQIKQNTRARMDCRV